MKNVTKLIGLAFIVILLTTSSAIVVNSQTSNEATVILAASTGGTTDPAPGTYTYPEGETITLIATANQGFEFQYWVISGTYLPTHAPPEILPNNEITQPPVFPDYSGINSLVIETTRLDVTCGYGYTFTYQPVFTPTNITTQETDATVIVANSVGGTTNPTPGTYIYPEGEIITLIASANQGFEFQYWLISGTYLPTHTPPEILPNSEINQPPLFPDYSGINSLVIEANRLDVTCGYGYTFTYQPVFTPTTPTDQTQETEATVIVAASVGGTTDPAPGTRIYPEGETITLIATADQGYEFQHWLISGTYLPTHTPQVILPNSEITQPPVFPDYSGINSLVIEANRLDITCGYGYTFTYQPIFSLIDEGTDQPEEPESPHGAFGLSVELVQILLIILVIAVIIAIVFGAYLYTKQKK